MEEEINQELKLELKTFLESTPELTCETMDQLSQAVILSAIETLFIDSDHSIPGVIDKESGEFLPASKGDVDGLNDLAIKVLKRGGKVRTLSSAEMPRKTPACALLRFPLPK